MNWTGWMNRKLITMFLMRQSSTCSSRVLPSSEAIAVPANSHITALTHRSLVRISGDDSSLLLQDLITADVTTLQESRALYSMMLNAQGRVLYDIILYHHGDSNCLIECDAQAAADVIKHLKRYALRSKVDVSSTDPDYKLWALYPGCLEVTASGDWHYKDPRQSGFGTRLLTTARNEITDLLSDGSIKEAPLDTYHVHRLKTGIAEGTEEIPVGSCFPLEYNLDYLNGVSFSKGCYLGQELTARTHHTGVIRKRVMPVSLSKRPVTDIPMGSTIVNNNGKSLGKLITHRREVGLALLRIKESADTELFLGDTIDGKRIGLLPHKPSWWPTTTLS